MTVPAFRPTLRSRWTAVFDDRGDARPYALTRALFGAIVIVHLWDMLEPALDGRTYHDRFHIPFWSWLPDPSPSLYTAMLWIGVAAGVGMIVGLMSRWATPIACAVVAYNVLLDQTGFHHNRAFLIYLLFGLSFVPTDRARSLDAWWARRRGRAKPAETSLWGLWLAPRPGGHGLPGFGGQQSARSGLAERAGEPGSDRPIHP